MEISDALLKTGMTTGGIAVGGFSVVWFARLMAARLIRQYDARHEKQETKLEQVSEKLTENLTDLKIKLAKLEPLIALAVSLRDDVKHNQDGVAVLKHTMSKTREDLKIAHDKIRFLEKRVESSNS